MVTPVSPVAVMLGKLLPYLVLGFVQLLVVLGLMTTVFRVPIHGNTALLLGLSTIYLFALLSLGLLVSSRARTQMEAIQIAQMFLLPSIMLSGYIFPSPRSPPPCASSPGSSPPPTTSRSRGASSSAGRASWTCGRTSSRSCSSPPCWWRAAPAPSARRSPDAPCRQRQPNDPQSPGGRYSTPPGSRRSTLEGALRRFMRRKGANGLVA